MRVLILSEAPANRKHGTGVQLLRTFAGRGLDMAIVYLRQDLGVSDCEEPSRLYHAPLFGWAAKWPTKGRGVLADIDRRVAKVRDGSFRREVIADLLRAEFDVAYVILSSEEYAKEIWEILQQVKCPFVLHIMDLYHTDGIEPQQMPGLSALISHAHSVLVISEPLKAEVEKCNPRSVRIVRIGQDSAVLCASPPGSEAGAPVRLVFVGSLWATHAGGVPVLCDALDTLTQKGHNVQATYAGAQYDNIPTAYQEKIRYAGFITDIAEYQKLLANSHIAFLPGPAAMDSLGKFSFPSRTADYMMAGLPILACVAEQTATAMVLDQLVPDGVRYTRNATQFVQAYEEFALDRKRWHEASTCVRRFGKENFDIDRVRERILESLAQAYAGKVRAKSVPSVSWTSQKI